MQVGTPIFKAGECVYGFQPGTVMYAQDAQIGTVHPAKQDSSTRF